MDVMLDIEKLLGSTDVELRREAVLRLRAFTGSPQAGEAVKLILRAMKDHIWRVRKTAVDTLIAAYPQEAYMKPLMNLLQLEENAGARNSAIEVFIRLGKRATDFLVAEFETPDTDLRKFIIDIIGQFRDRRSLPLLIAALEDEDENVRAAAVEYLGDMKESSVVDALIGILREQDLWTAYPAADALGRIGDRKAVPALIEALGNKTLREPSLRALGNISDGSSVSSIASMMDDRSKSVQHEAVTALERLYHGGVPEEAIVGAVRERYGEGALELLVGHSRSSRAEVRHSAILLLGLMKDEKALGPLLELSGDDNFTGSVRKALTFIGRSNPDSLIPLFETLDPYLRRFMCGVASEVASPAYYEALSGFLRNEDGHVRAEAALGLSNIGDIRAVPNIMPLLEDPYVDVQEAAIRSLAVLRDGLDSGGLLEGLRSRSPVLRKNLVLLLGQVGGADIVSEIGYMLRDEDVLVRKAAVTALSGIGTMDSYHQLSMALTDEENDIRVAAVLSLGASGDVTYADGLSVLLDDREDMVKVAAAKALGMLGEVEVMPALIGMFTHENGLVVTAAIDAAGKLGGDDAFEALTSMLSSTDNEIKRSVIRALSGFEGAETYILPFIRHEDWAVRVAAVEALGGVHNDLVRTELERIFDSEEDPVVKKTLEKCLNV